MSVKNLGQTMPVYVTRKMGNGDIVYYSMSIWMSLLVMFLAWINVVVWGVLGLYFAVRVFV